MAKKARGKDGPLGLHNSFKQKTVTSAIFRLTPAANMLSTSQFFYWLHDMAACCHFGFDVLNQPDHNFPSSLTDVIPHSSSDLLSSSLVLLVTLLDKIF